MTFTFCRRIAALREQFERAAWIESAAERLAGRIAVIAVEAAPRVLA